MKRKIFLLLLIFFVLTPSFCWARKELEIRYPEILGFRPKTLRTLLPEYIRYLFTFAIMISGVIAFGSLVYGGVLYLISAGDPKKLKSAKDRILSSLVGFVIVFGAYLLLTTINPQLVVLEVEIEAIGGVELFADKNCEGDSRVIGRSTTDFGDFEAESLKFLVDPGELEVLVFQKKNYEGTAHRTSSDNQGCINFHIGRSIKFFWKLPGVYLCTSTLKDGICEEGIETRLLSEKTNLLGSELSQFNDKVRAIKFRPLWEYMITWQPGVNLSYLEYECKHKGGLYVDRQGDKLYCVSAEYGAILHEHLDYKGEAGVILETVPDLREETRVGRVVVPLDRKVSSVTTFLKRKVKKAEADSKSVGVWICTEKDPPPPGSEGFDEICRGPFKPQKGETILEVENIKKKDIDPGEIRSIINEGGYTIVLFRERSSKGSAYAFNQNVGNLYNYLDTGLVYYTFVGFQLKLNPLKFKAHPYAESFMVIATGTAPPIKEAVKEDELPAPPSACSNECECEGGKRCTGEDPFVFQICDDYNEDGCLEWGGDDSCGGFTHCEEKDGPCTAECVE